MKRSEIFFGIIRVPLDYMAAIGAFFTAYSLRTEDEFYFLFGAPVGEVDPLNVYLRFAAWAAIILLAIFAFEGMYSLKSTFRFKREVRRIVLLCSAWFMILIAYFFVMRIQFFSRLILGYTFILTVLFIIATRICIRIAQRFLLSKNIGKRRVMFIGNNKIAGELCEWFAKNPSYKIVGIIPDTEIENLTGKSISERIKERSLKLLEALKNFRHPEATKIISMEKNLEETLKENRVDEVIQTRSRLTQDTAAKILEICQVNHITYRFVPDLLDVQRTNVEFAFYKGIPVITLRETPLDAWGRVAKRAFDMTISATALVTLSPVFLVVAGLIKLDSRGPVFYASKRVSAKGNTFNVMKFRSMVIGAEKRKGEFAHLNHRKGPLFKIKHDPRVTRFGKFIRKTSLDELPQLINVLVGNMSLVGPRPHLVEEVAKYERHHKKVLAIKPGITGIAQISGRSDLDFEEEVKLDTYYIENWSLLLDIIILLKTIPAVLRGKSAD